MTSSDLIQVSVKNLQFLINKFKVFEATFFFQFKICYVKSFNLKCLVTQTLIKDYFFPHSKPLIQRFNETGAIEIKKKFQLIKSFHFDYRIHKVESLRF